MIGMLRRDDDYTMKTRSLPKNLVPLTTACEGVASIAVLTDSRRAVAQEL